ncbi:CBO0543 family protein [Bacillaceae bacterium S4-13-56]
MSYLFKQFHQLQTEHYHYWLEHTLWSLHFWILLFLATVPWIFWYKYKKEKREVRLLLAGGFALVTSAYLDFLGIVLGLWEYKAMLIPTIPAFMPWDITLIPVTIMVWIQAFPKWSSLKKGMVYAAIVSFVGEPVFIWIDLYNQKMWNSFYSFPFYVIIYMISHKISGANRWKHL